MDDKTIKKLFQLGIEVILIIGILAVILIGNGERVDVVITLCTWYLAWVIKEQNNG